MKKNQNMIVTTTSTIQDWDIQEYLGPISSHVVAGTNVFSDMFAEFSDFFGGRSRSYQKQLTSIHSEAIELLKTKANSLGANCILGLRIDHDEISGKNKSMFMVTAVGTAVNVKPKSGNEQSSATKFNSINTRELEILLRKKEIIEKAKKQELVLNEEKLVLNEDTWNFIIENQINEISPLFLQTLNELYEKESIVDFDDKKYIRKCKDFFLNLPEEITKDILYNAILNYTNIFPFIMEIINEGTLLDFEQIDKLLDSNDSKIKKGALILLQYDKTAYKPSDIEKLSKIINKIKSIFMIRIKYVEEKSKFSSNVKKKWICGCGNKNDIKKEYCSKCGKDTYGFEKYRYNKLEVRPAEILELLNDKSEVLKEHFI